MVQKIMRAAFGSFSGGRSTMAEYSARSLGIMGRDMDAALNTSFGARDVAHRRRTCPGRASAASDDPGHEAAVSFRRLLRQQRLAGPDAAEDNRFGRDLEAVFDGADDGVV